MPECTERVILHERADPSNKKDFVIFNLSKKSTQKDLRSKSMIFFLNTNNYKKVQ